MGTVLVTGATSGIGAATVAALKHSGHSVIGAARSRDALDRVTAEYPGFAGKVCDVVDAAAVEVLIAGIIADHGRIDAVVHCAQVMAYGRIEDVPAAIFDRVVDTAIHGTANLARSVMPHFRSSGRGTLVIVNSLLGEVPTPLMGVYDTAKWGQLGLARVLQLETHRDRHIHVCTVAPGAINTPIYDQAANFSGRDGAPPPPVYPPERVAQVVLELLERPKRHVEVGILNRPTVAGFRASPRLYNAIVGPLVDRLVFSKRAAEPSPGNVLTPNPGGEAVRGRWSVLGRRLN